MHAPRPLSYQRPEDNPTQMVADDTWLTLEVSALQREVMKDPAIARSDYLSLSTSFSRCGGRRSRSAGPAGAQGGLCAAAGRCQTKRVGPARVVLVIVTWCVERVRWVGATRYGSLPWLALRSVSMRFLRRQGACLSSLQEPGTGLVLVPASFSLSLRAWARPTCKYLKACSDVPLRRAGSAARAQGRLAGWYK
jgi:hypothetical protein